jgi:cyanophycin synthetase
MKLIDSRRLTGPNLLSDYPGAIIDIEIDRDGDDIESFITNWQHWMQRAADALGLHNQQAFVRRYRRGASLAVSAPIDVLYAMSDIQDWAYRAAIDPPDEKNFAQNCARFAQSLAEDANPRLLALQNASLDRSVPFLWDDDIVSLGLGERSQHWPSDELPAVDTVEWASLGTIPIALITGTNGKTTTTRLLAHIARCAGLVVGSSGTDWIAVGDEILDRGDYSGPGGARGVLRDRRVQIGLLETARGGMLRRGLACQRADCALITNVAEDHLGEFGVESIEQLADVKWVVSRAVTHSGGTLVLNADDPPLVARAENYPGAIAWFSRTKSTFPQGVPDRALVDSESLVVVRNDRQWLRVPLAEVPITFAGAAEHNVDNALAAAMLAAVLGLPADAVEQGLRTFKPNDNPGRGNIIEVGGRTVLIDFAHNPHGVRAIMKLARSQPAARRLLLIGQAGDRGDDDIRALAAAVEPLDFDRILIKNLDEYARGRASGETAGILWQTFVDLGVSESVMQRCTDEMEACQLAMDWSRSGDQLVLLVHAQRDAVLEFFRMGMGAG